MNFTVTTIARSLAAHLAPVLPGVQMLEDPAQQGVEPPCMFLQQRYYNIKPHPGGRWLRTIGVDLTYLLGLQPAPTCSSSTVPPQKP